MFVQVIRGWDTGVAKMKVGESALLTCRHDYAYGERGATASGFPAKATLVFEVCRWLPACHVYS